MLRGLTVSTIVHASVIAMAVLSWPHKKSDCDRMIERLQREEPGLSPVDVLMRIPQCASAIDVPIDFVEIGLVTDIAPVQKAEEPKEEEEAVPEEAEEQPEPPPQEESAPEEEEEVVIPDETAEPEPPPKKEEPKKEPPKKEEPKLIEKQKPKAADDLDFLNEFEDILKDKAQDERRKPREEAPPQINKPVLTDAQEARPGAGERRGNTASLQTAMRAQISYCWIGVSDLPKEYQTNVVVRITLDRNGNLLGNARLVSPSSQPIGRAGVPVQRALQAVRKCVPYKLPPDDYEQWKDIEVTIGPTD